MPAPRTRANRDLPPRMLRRRRPLKSGKVWIGYYYTTTDDDGRRKEIPLGTDFAQAKRRWAELELEQIPAEVTLMRHVFERYEKQVVPKKGSSTQRQNLQALKMLHKIFDSAPIESITPQMLARYRDERSVNTPTAANRELSIFSHVWNMAREWGYTDRENPVAGVRRNKLPPRDVYIDDDVWQLVYEHASPLVRDAMDVAYLTGQRPADVLKMRFTDIHDGALNVLQNKTGHRLRILLHDSEGRPNKLSAVLQRIKSTPRNVASIYIIATPSGAPVTTDNLKHRFAAIRSAAVKSAKEAGDESLAKRVQMFQFRDIRPKAASEIDLAHASKLLGHTQQEITKRVYRRVGDVVEPTK